MVNSAATQISAQICLLYLTIVEDGVDYPGHDDAMSTIAVIVIVTVIVGDEVRGVVCVGAQAYVAWTNDLLPPPHPVSGGVTFDPRIRR